MWCAIGARHDAPDRGPMIYTYAELAETAARKGEERLAPGSGRRLCRGLVGAALDLAALQFVFSRSRCSTPRWRPQARCFRCPVDAAGSTSFSSLKLPCVTQCQHPFRFFFRQLDRRAGPRVRARIAPGALLPRLLLR